MNTTNQLEEAVNLALKLSPKERIQLIERVASSVEHDIEETPKSDDASGDTRWGENLVRLLDEIGPIEFVHPEIADPTEWVKFMRNQERKKRLGDWGEDE